MKNRYIYPAIIHHNKQDEAYEVSFPDIDNCFTFGNILEDALDQVKDVLQLIIYDIEEEHKEIPIPSSIKNIENPQGDIITLIDVWMVAFRDKMANT